MTPRAVRQKPFQLGTKGQRLVTVVQESSDRIRATWFLAGRRRGRKLFADWSAAHLWAETWYRAGERASAQLSLRGLFDRYLATMAELKGWRGSTVLNYGAHRKRIEEALGPDIQVNDLTLNSLDTLWGRLTDLGITPNQIRAKVKLLQRACTWAYARDLTTHNKLAQWAEMPSVSPRKIAEYTPDEVQRILEAFEYRDAWDWRPWALVMLEQSQGFRINALLHLRWEDVDLVRGRFILRKAFDKTKKEDWERPMHWDAYAAVLTARWHADRLGKASEWVFYGKGGRPYTYQAFHTALEKAERRADVPHLLYRGSHGFRRHAVNEARAATGDVTLAMLSVGDTDLRAAGSYVRAREAELQALADRREDA